MHTLTTHYGSATGPLGFPCQDKVAYALDAILKSLPKDDAFKYRKAIIEKAPTELGDRSDVSWISTEDPDRCNDVVLARGMNDSQFKQNPIVTLNHSYWQPPVGKSLWRKFVKDGDMRGIKAKTQYPAKPNDWNDTWPADVAFQLIQADLLRGKSIGFLPTKVHTPDSKELDQPGWQKVGCVIDEWILLEYACVFLPAQQNAVVESVGKSIPEDIRKALGIQFKAFEQPKPTPEPLIPFRCVGDLQKTLANALAKVNPIDLAEKIVNDRIDLLKGRV